MKDSIEVVLGEEAKHYRVDTSAIETGAEMPGLAKDGVFAWELYAAGLTCSLGKEVTHGEDVDPVVAFIGDADVKQCMADFRETGTPVYMGPFATMDEDGMTVVVSDSRSSSFGLWTPRAGADFKPWQINYVRLN